MKQRLIRFSIVKIMTLCFFLVHPFLSGAQEKTEKSCRPKIALVLSGGGIKYGLKTFVGPMDMTLGYSGSTGKPTFSANFGYWF